MLAVVQGELCSDQAMLGDWDQAARHARAAAEARRLQCLPLVTPWRWTETEALVRAGDRALAEEDARRWGELVAGVPRLRVPHLRSLAVLARAAGHTETASACLAEAKTLAASLQIVVG